MPIEFNLQKWVISSIGVTLVVFLLVLAGSVIYSARMADISVKYSQMESTNKKVQGKIDEYTLKTEELKTVIGSLRDKDQELRKLLGLRPNNIYFPVDLKKKTLKSDDPLKVGLNDVKYNLKYLEAYAKSQKRSYDNLYATIVTLKRDFDRTPSIWPLYGAIAAGFGYRMHPILGIVQFHSGIDIPAWIGAPIRASATGTVIAAAWDGNYGNTTIIEHHNGIRTVYAHLSKFLVKPGQEVKKGQLIALTGSTGLSTGPHLHYEVRYGNKPVNPSNYLNLDIFSYNRNIRGAM